MTLRTHWPEIGRFAHSNHDGRGEAARRSELYRSFGSLCSESGQEAKSDCIQWRRQEWSGTSASILSVLDLYVEWSKRRRIAENADSVVPSIGGYIGTTQPGFIFVMQCGRGSITPRMRAKARNWNSRKQNGDVSMLLRITMLLHCFQELAQRASQLQLEAKKDTLVMNLRSKGILTEDNK